MTLQSKYPLVRVFWFLLLIFLSSKALSQESFYQRDSIQTIQIYFAESNWDHRLDTAKHGSDGYISADRIVINGTELKTVGVKYKGNSSYDSTSGKNPIHVELNHYKDQDYLGFTDIKLGNGYADPSMIREVLSYQILGNYMHAPKANFAKVFVNDKYLGLYSNVESVNKSFCSRHFYSDEGVFFKCNPLMTPGPSTKSNLKFLGYDSTVYYNLYEKKSESGWAELVRLCDTTTNFKDRIGNSLDIDKVLWMLAFNAIMVNLDSYSGAFCQNYYLFKDLTNRFVPIVWDLNMSLGGFPFAGNSNSSLGSLGISDMQQLSLSIHQNDQYWPLIQAVLNNPDFKKIYLAHAKILFEEFMANDSCLVFAKQMHDFIEPEVSKDSNTFFSYNIFKNSITTNTPNGSYSIPGIEVLLDGRKNYLQGLSDFQIASPIVEYIAVGNISPKLLSNVTIKAVVSKANAVYLKYRFNVFEKFQVIEMYDDGRHDDRNAGDSIFGASVLMESTNLQYYIFCENTDAVTFFPERAEYEFLELNAAVPGIFVGDIRINEFMADNKDSDVDESGQNGDWLELYNTTNDTLYLGGLLLSNDKGSPFKYRFPSASFITPKGFKIVWADEKWNTEKYLHANFRLVSSGDQIFLSNYKGMILDSVSFGVQDEDFSQTRCPDGALRWESRRLSTFHSSNNIFCKSLCNSERKETKHILFPNPANGQLHVKTNEKGNYFLRIIDSEGLILLENYFIGEETTVSTTEWENGLYILLLQDMKGFQQAFKFMISHL